MKPIGPSFADELRTAGLVGLPFAWGADGRFQFDPSMTTEQIAAVQAVYAAHDPDKSNHNASIDAQIVALEQGAGGYNRGMREFMLGMAVILDTARAAANSNPALSALASAFPDIKPTPGMAKIKAVDDQIKTLRAQRLP